MQEALFSEPQTAVTVKKIDGERQYTICLNERIEEVTDEMSGETYTIYVYDFNQFKDGSVSEKDVLENPSEYLDYVPKIKPPVTPKNVEQRVTELEERQDIAEQALQDTILLLIGEDD